MGAATAPWTADELKRLPDGWRYEIDRGELVIMTPAGRWHTRITAAITRHLGNFVHDHQLGEVDSREVAVYIERHPAETVRGIDVVFFSTAKVAEMADSSGFFDVLPDLAVEVHEATDPVLLRKVDQYRAAGIGSVWVVDPKVQSLTPYWPGAEPRTLTEPGDVVQDPVLPGFACRLQDFFE